MTEQKFSYSRLARRIRVPLGFVFAAVYLWLAHPDWISLAMGAAVVVPGVALRGLASGHVKKNAELTTSGPYAYTRNPLYLGSIIIALGFAVAAKNLWIGVGLMVLFFAIYLPVIKSEEQFLRGAFSDFDDYAARVPRLFPRLWPAPGNELGNFSGALYLKHREYNALIGSLLLFSALAAKIILKSNQLISHLW